MPVTGSQLLHSWVLDGAVAAHDHTLRGFRNSRISDQVTQILDAGGSEIDPSIRYITGIMPICTVESMDCKTIADALWGNSNILPHIPIAGGTGLDLWFQDLSNGGTRSTTGTKFTITKGLVLPQRLAGGQRRHAGLSLQVYAIFDGTNIPIQKSTGQTLAVASPGSATGWKCAAVVDHATTIHEIGDWSIDFGIQVDPFQAGNSIYTNGVPITGFMPTAQFTTRDLAAALTLSNMNAKNPGANGLQFYLSEFDAAGVGVKASTALKFIFHTASCYKPETLAMAPGGLIIPYTVMGCGATPDETVAAAPLKYTTGNANVAEQSTQVQYTPGPIKDNTTEVSYHDANLQFNIAIEMRRAGSELWNTLWYVKERKPSISVRTDDSAFYAALGVGGRAVATGFHFYARKMTENSQPIANASAAHVKITVNQGWISPAGGGGAHNETAQWEFQVDATKGGSAMLTVAVASAIS